jgi:hypothetical protein
MTKVFPPPLCQHASPICMPQLLSCVAVDRKCLLSTRTTVVCRWCWWCCVRLFCSCLQGRAGVHSFSGAAGESWKPTRNMPATSKEREVTACPHTSTRLRCWLASWLHAALQPSLVCGHGHSLFPAISHFFWMWPSVLRGDIHLLSVLRAVLGCHHNQSTAVRTAGVMGQSQSEIAHAISDLNLPVNTYCSC